MAKALTDVVCVLEVIYFERKAHLVDCLRLNLQDLSEVKGAGHVGAETI